MGQIFDAIIPIFLLIALGTFLKSKIGFSDDFWRSIEKLTFKILFPSLLFVKISDANIDWTTALPIAAISVIAILLTTLIAVPLGKLLKLEPKQFVAVFQGSFRSNAYVGIAIVLGVLGDKATGEMSVNLLAVGITINFLGVWGHLKWIDAGGQARGWRGVAIDSLKNPMIQACLVGGLFNITGWGLPPLIGPTLDLLSRAALPMGLMAVGTGLSIASIKNARASVATSCALKLLVLPVLTYGMGLLFGLEGYALIVPLIFAALPTSSTSYVVSRQMGSDAELMAAIVTGSHLAAMVTLPVLLTLIH